MHMKIQIYLSNLAKYTEGRENGEWLILPKTEEQLEEVFEKIVGKGNEHIILDYDAPFEIGEYDNIFELNEYMMELNENGVDELTVNILEKVVDTKEELKSVLANGNYIIIDVDSEIHGWSTNIVDDDIRGRVLHDLGFNTVFKAHVPEEIEDYIDWESVYRDLSINDGWYDVRRNNTDYLVRILKKRVFA